MLPQSLGQPAFGGHMAELDQRPEETLHFRWLEAGRMPSNFDLRQCGWKLDEAGEPSSECIGLLHAGDLDHRSWARIRALRTDIRRFILVLGVTGPQERALLLQEGFGEAVSDTIAIEELGARASRLAEFTRWLPRYRRIGDLELDLLAREAYGRGKPLNLNPREFALIWRLSDNPGQPVSKQVLIHDVWRMGFVPETNSIAVHMSRLRRKLGFVDLSNLIATASAGGYCLALPPEQLQEDARDFASTPRNPAPAASQQALF